jgi:signal transduction histidine kinase
MQSGLRSVNDMVEQLHEIGLLELERIDLAMIKVDITWIGQEVCDILQARAISKKQSLEFKRNEYPLYVEVDIPKIKRVLFNLVGNAIKYTHNGGRISVLVEKDLGMAVIRVSDTGIGIPKEKLGVIFEPFSKLKSRGTNGEASNGLGLFTANYMTRLFKGSISVVSQEGQGSTFTLRLPLVVNI